MELKTDALLLRAADYGENDKIVTLLTAQYGKIGAAVKGVKKANAKLKFAAQPFCFAEYVLAERSGRHTVISASLYDGFYSLREDVEAYYGGVVVCEACDKLIYEGMPCEELLVEAVRALKGLSAGQGADSVIAFLLAALRQAGYPVKAENCPHCGKALSGRMRFDMESGTFSCEACGGGTAASESTYRAIRRAEQVHGGADERDADGQRRALRLLGAYFNYQTEAELNALPELIGLIAK